MYALGVTIDSLGQHGEYARRSAPVTFVTRHVLRDVMNKACIGLHITVHPGQHLPKVDGKRVSEPNVKNIESTCKMMRGSVFSNHQVQMTATYM